MSPREGDALFERARALRASAGAIFRVPLVPSTAMPNSPEFIEHLTDLFEEVAPVPVRRMFGGAGVFREYWNRPDATRAAFASSASSWPRSAATSSRSSITARGCPSRSARRRWS